MRNLLQEKNYNASSTVYEILNDYCDLISETEKKQLSNMYNREIIGTNNEIYLKNICKKIWNKQLENNYIISWLKNDEYNQKNEMIFATINNNEQVFPFCDSKIGILYDINYDSILSATPKDGATVLCRGIEESVYTIYKNKDYVINSYNLGNNLVVPSQLYKCDNYNEIVLLPDLIRPKKIVYLEQYVYEKALKLSNDLNLPLESYDNLLNSHNIKK